MERTSTPRALSAVAILVVVSVSGCGPRTVPSAHAPAGIAAATHTRSPHDLNDGLIHAAAVSDDLGCAYDSNGIVIRQTVQVTHGTYGPYTMSTLPSNWATFFATYEAWPNYPTLPAFPMIYALQSDVDAFMALDAPFMIDFQTVDQSGLCSPDSEPNVQPRTYKMPFKLPPLRWYDPLTM